MKNNYSLGNRLIALALCVIMVLGMLPAQAIAQEITPVAKIGDTPFDTLADALAAVPTETNQKAPTEATTVVLLQDVAYAFDVGTSNGSKTMNLVLDLNGKTLTLKPGVGSVGTESNGIRVLAYSKLEIKNGTVVCSSEAADNVKVGIANYSELTLDSVTMQAGAQTVYTINNRGALTLKGTTSVKEGSASICAITNDPYNYYYTENVDASITCDSSSVSVDSVFVERYARDSSNKGSVKLNISAGNFGELKEDGNSSVSTNYNVTGGTIAVSSTEELELALRAVKAGAAYSCPEKAVTIKLLQDISGSFDVGTSTGKAPKNIILDLDGKTLMLKPGVGSVGTKSNGIRVLAYSKLTVKNGTLACSDAVEDNVKVGIANYSQLRLDNVKVKAGDQTIYTINNRGKLDLTNGTEVENAKLPHGDYADSAELVAITNDPYGQCYTTPIDAELNCSDSSVKVGNVQLETYGQKGDIQLNITAGTFGEVHKPASTGSVDVKGNISGGKFESDVNDYCVDDYQVVKDSNNNYVVKKDRTDFGFSQDKFEVIFGQNGNKFQQTVADTSSTVTYSILEGEDVATINNDRTGELTIKKAGTVKVQALAESDDQYHEAKATYTLVVKPAYAEVHSFSGGEITGSKTENTVVTIAEATLQWCEKDESVGRNQDGWWVGIKIVAPDGVDLSKAIYQRRSGGTFDGAEVKTFEPERDRYLGMWGLITADYLESFSNSGKKMNYVWRFSWDGDDVYEQTIAITIDPNGITLKQDGFGFSATSDTIIYGANGNIYMPLVPSGGQAGTLKYSTSDDTIAKANDDGTLTILKAGEVTVTATLSGTHYENISASYTLTINKAAQPAKFAEAAPAVTFNDNGNKFTQLVEDAQGKVTYSIVEELYEGQATYNGEPVNVADINTVTGELTIHQSGTVTVKATVTGDDNYLPGEVTYTLTVNKAAQPAKFAEAAPAVKFNDNNNKFTQQVDDAQGTVTYAIVSEQYDGEPADVADINTTTGELTIHQSGTVKVKATVAGNERYRSGDVTYTLTVDKAEQSFTFNHGQSKDVTIKYGTSFTTVIDKSEKNSGNVSYAVTNTIGASVDENGKVTFVDSNDKVGTVDVTVTMLEDVRYKAFSDTYKIKVEYETVQTPYSLGAGANAKGWYKTDVEIFAPAGYKISYSNQLANNIWDDKVVWNTTDGEDGRWPQNGEPYICLKNEQTGAITDKIYVFDLKRDTILPDNLSITYGAHTWVEYLGQLFGLNKETTTVTVGATDDMSGIAEMQYSINGTDFIDIPLENNAYKFTIDTQFRNRLILKATDAAGNSVTFADKNSAGKPEILVVDYIAPDIVATFAGGMDDLAAEGPRYVKGEKITVSFKITGDNFDLRAADPVVTVTKNGQQVQTPDWTFASNTEGTLSFDLAEEGDYIVKATFEDRLDRVDNYATEIRIDRTKPTIASDIEETIYTQNPTFNLKITEHNFDPARVNLQVSAVDSKAQAVLSQQEMDAFATLAKNPSKWQSNGDVHTLALPITKDGNYTVTATCTDVLGWDVEQAYTKQFTLDKVAPVAPAIVYEVGAQKTGLIEKLLGKLFGFASETTLVTISSDDATSGIKQLEYKLHDEDAFTTVTMDANGKYSFNLDPQYRGRITMKVTDNAGHTSETVDNKDVVIDDIAPEVKVQFAGARKDTVKNDDTRETMGIFDSTTRYIYNGAVTVTIQVKEANFFEDVDLPVSVYRDGQLAVSGITSSDWVENNGKFVKTIVLEEDGDYQIKATYEDHSRNDMQWTSEEYAQTGTYTYESNIHTVDTTKPVYEVTYDNNTVIQTVDGLDYYADVRTATITVEDRNFRPSEVELNVAAKDFLGQDVEYTYSKLNTWEDWTQDQENENLWTATVAMDADAKYTVDLSYKDLAENPIEAYHAEFVVDTTKPADLKVTYRSKDATILNAIVNAVTFGNYAAKQEVVLTMKDATSGVDYISLTVSPEGSDCATNLTMPANLLIKADGTVISGEKGFIKKIRSSLSSTDGTRTLSFDVPAQFRGNVAFSAYDISGNLNDYHEDPGDFVVDTIAPGHTVSYNPSNVVNSKTMKDKTVEQTVQDITSTRDSYVMYFNKDATATIAITEANFEGKQVTVQVLDAAGNVVSGCKQSAWKTTKTEGATDVHTKTVTISEEGDYRIKVFYQDRSMNTPVDYLSQRIVVDKTAPKIDVAYSNTDIKNTIDGRDYLDAKQTATVTITEHNFRPDDVVIKVTAKDVLGTDVLELTEDGYVKSYAQQGAKRSEWTDYEAGTWRREDDKFVLTLNYTTDANYTFDIAYQDLATNEAADYQQDLFTVDTTAPKKLDVSYSTSIFEQIKQSITFGYYNAKMTVTIVAEDATSGIYHFAYSYINGEDVSKVNAELLNKAIKEAKISYEGKKATATFSIPKMVLGADNQFNGTVEFDAYDRSENSTNLKDSTVIVVDNIAPTSKITYSPPVDKENGISYYDGNINATIVINEANFDAKDVVVSVTKDGARFPVGVVWNDDSVDVHTGTFTLTKDGDYVVSVQYKDKSGNKMVNYTSNQLTVDKTKPTIKVSNIKANSANKDEQYGFVITVNDTNLDISSIKLALKAVQGDDGKPVDIDLGEAKTVVKDQTYTYTVKDLPEDGLYTLTCQVWDMSKNDISEIALEDGKKYEQVQFSINRNGSTFGYGSQYSEELVEKYYIYSVDEDVVIVEVNVDPIEEYKVTLNGEELVENTHYTTTQTSNANEWSKRTYTIKKSLFEAEGEYNIIVSSVDKAETTAYSDIKNLQVKFVVDQTKPVITITGMEDSGRYRTDLQTVTIIPTDEGGRLNSISVVVLASNGTPLKDDAGNDISVRFEMAGEELLNYLEEKDGKITFTIPEGLNNQVKIICTDCAMDATGVTNEYNELFERVTVSPNEFVIFYANTSLFVGSIVGVLAIIGLIIFLIKRRKAKKDRKA